MSAFRKRMTGLLQRRESDDVDDSTSVVPLIRRWCISARTVDDIAALSQLPDVFFSDPRQAQEGAKQIRKTLADKSKAENGEMYNAQMLVSTLTRHQDSAIFTQHIDDRFVGTMRGILRDETPATASTRLLIRDIIVEYEKTIDGSNSAAEPVPSLRAESEHRAARWATDAGIQRILELRKDPKNWQWLAQQQRSLARNFQGHGATPPGSHIQQINGPSNGTQIAQGLPNVLELSERLKEAEESCKILEQNMNYRAGDIQGLFKDPLFIEFSERCKVANTSLQAYLDAVHNGSPHEYDDATVQSITASRNRLGAVLEAREQKQRAYNILRGQSRSPAPIAPGARAEDPFDDRNALAVAGNARTHASASQPHGLQRPSLAVGTGSASQISFNGTNNRSVSGGASTVEAPQPQRYLF